jgi:hypothetical protein
VDPTATIRVRPLVRSVPPQLHYPIPALQQDPSVSPFLPVQSSIQTNVHPDVRLELFLRQVPRLVRPVPTAQSHLLVLRNVNLVVPVLLQMLPKRLVPRLPHGKSVNDERSQLAQLVTKLVQLEGERV